MEEDQLNNIPDNACDMLSDERYKAFIENISDGVYETDAQGHFTYFNQSFCKVFGFSREELQGAHFSDFMDKNNARRVYNAFTKIWVTREGFSNLNWEIVDRSGSNRIIEMSASLIINSAGKKIGFRGIARDMTERHNTLELLKNSEARLQKALKESRRNERRNQALLEFIHYPLVIFNLDGEVFYLNPAFTETFGWTLEELQGKKIPYVPEELDEETRENIKRLFEERIILRYETKRLTKDGRILDVIMRGAIYSTHPDDPGGELIMFRDITEVKRMQRINESLLRISLALPEYPDLEELLDYISSEIKELLKARTAVVVLLDEEKNEVYFQSAATDMKDRQDVIKGIRFPADRGIIGKVIKTGEPVIASDVVNNPEWYDVIEQQHSFNTTDVMYVPLRSHDRIIGVLSAYNKKEGKFEKSDIELLNMISGTVALSIENARFSQEIREAYREVTSMNKAKDKVISHLSHELKTPTAVLSSTLGIIARKVKDLPQSVDLEPSVARAKRNLDRLLEIQYEVEDIMENKDYESYQLLTTLLDNCRDELQALVAYETGDESIAEKIAKRIDDIYGTKTTRSDKIQLNDFVKERIKYIEPNISHRRVELNAQYESVPTISVPADVLSKVINGLVKNAVENTPDQGKIDIKVQPKGEWAELIVRDYGVGITEDNQRRIFEGFFTTQETLDYSSKKPFDFNAGGKGADLLRMKIFAERYNFKIEMESSRCGFIPQASDICPGTISLCNFCKEENDCYQSGGTTFTVSFPPQ